MRHQPDCRNVFHICLFAALWFAVGAVAEGASAQPAPPQNVQVADVGLDLGDKVRVTWKAPAESSSAVTAFKVYWIFTESSAQRALAKEEEHIVELEGKLREHPDRETLRKLLRDACNVRTAIRQNQPRLAGTVAFEANKDDYEIVVDKLRQGFEYIFEVRSVGEAGMESPPATSSTVVPKVQYFDGERVNLVVIAAIVCGSIIAFILIARSGVPLKIRKIAGLEAVDEAVGRATEMGRPILFVPGIQDMNDMMTLAGLTALGHVAKKAAEYDAKLEVPTSKSLVMTAARETVQSAFLAAGRPDAYNQDLIYYVTDEQFGYVAYLSGHMARQKPAACFYLGAFFAESLILAETGNSVGAIQIAGTAETAQLPFFVAACDYTLIGEEFYAASAYLSGEPDQLGSLRGQDVGKAIVAAGLAVGCIIATIAAIWPESDAVSWLNFLKTDMLR